MRYFIFKKSFAQDSDLFTSRFLALRKFQEDNGIKLNKVRDVAGEEISRAVATALFSCASNEVFEVFKLVFSDIVQEIDTKGNTLPMKKIDKLRK